MSQHIPVIRIDPEIMHGTPVFVGTRVPAVTLWHYLEAGDSLEDFLEGFPSVRREQAVGLIRKVKERAARCPFSNAAKIQAFLRFLGAHAQGSGTVYLAGGASAVIMGWRNTAMDVDLKLEPQPPGAFEAIARAKEELDINVDLAAPDDFIPALPDWRERSLFIARHGTVEFFHYDFYAQALAKIARGHEQDLHDVKAMHRRKRIEPKPLMRLFEAIEPGLLRYPAISPARLRDRVRWLIAELRRGKGNADERRPTASLNAEEIPSNFPGADLIAPGIGAVERKEITTEGLLVTVATTRLRDLGLAIPDAADAIKEPNLALYTAVCEAGGGHSDYNALIQRIVSFANAADLLLPNPD